MYAGLSCRKRPQQVPLLPVPSSQMIMGKGINICEQCLNQIGSPEADPEMRTYVQ
jgi:hypothetical protein